jgi:uncharacterized glyoxalase superfamily protein PhnB
MGRGLVPYLCCADAAAAIDFYITTFGAVEEQLRERVGDQYDITDQRSG